MTPLFIVSPPRSRGTVLARLLNATGVATVGGEADDLVAHLRKLVGSRARHLSRHENDEWPRYWLAGGEGGSDAWDQATLDLLPAWVQPRVADTHFGVRLAWLGREGLVEAFEWWSWLLETWPHSRILFLARDQGDIEMSMLATSDLWVPKWGVCSGCVGGRVHRMLDAMEQFHWLNPTRTLLLDADVMVKDYGRFAEAMDPLGIGLNRQAWESVVGEVIGSYKQLRPQDPADPFHPMASPDAVAALPGPEAPKVFDAFAPETTELDIEILPGPASQTPIVFATERRIRLWEPKRYKPVAADQLAVYTLRWGDKPWMGPCVRSQEQWAARHGYEIQVWGEPVAPYPNPKFSCLDMIRDFLAGDKKVMVYFDADVMLHPDAPGWEDRPGFRVAADSCNNPKFWVRLKRWKRQHYPGLKDGDHIYRNAGVWSCDRESARRFLREADSADRLIEGCMEQHQFNVFWSRAAQVGMRLELLDESWNMMVHNRPEEPAWLFHLAGGEKNKPGYIQRLYERGLFPRPPRPFKEVKPKSKRAICIPWLSGPATWEELRFALRSWLKYFKDKRCPIYILGDQPPPWLVEGGRVKFIRVAGYERSWEEGMFEARTIAYQIADKVIFTNDDIYLLRAQSWEDFEVALTEGTLHHRVATDIEHANPWRRYLGYGTANLMHQGLRKVGRFATHTPVLYEAEKAREIFRRFHVYYKGTFANMYFNWHRIPRRPCGKDKATSWPPREGARFLNHGGGMPSPQICQGLMERFDQAAPWEDPLVPVKDPRIPPPVRLCIASYGENLEWFPGTGIPAVVYDATGDSTEYVPVANVGREAGQYLRHILDHYGRFAEYEIFLQGNPFDHNPAVLDLLAQRPWQGKRAVALAPLLTKENQVNTPRAITFAKGLKLPYTEETPWAQGALFAASREALMSRSRKWWAMLLRKVEEDQYSPWSMERLWLLILDPEGIMESRPR